MLGRLAIPGFPLRFSAQPERPELVAPLLGHSDAIMNAQPIRLSPHRASRVIVTANEPATRHPPGARARISGAK